MGLLGAPSSQGWPLSSPQESTSATRELCVGKAALQPGVLARGCRIWPQSHPPLRQTSPTLSFQSAASDPGGIFCPRGAPGREGNVLHRKKRSKDAQEDWISADSATNQSGAPQAGDVLSSPAHAEQGVGCPGGAEPHLRLTDRFAIPVCAIPGCLPEPFFVGG